MKVNNLTGEAISVERAAISAAADSSSSGGKTEIFTAGHQTRLQWLVWNILARNLVKEFSNKSVQVPSLMVRATLHLDPQIFSDEYGTGTVSN